MNSPPFVDLAADGDRVCSCAVVPPGDAQHLGQASGWRFTLRAAAMAWVTPSGS